MFEVSRGSSRLCLKFLLLRVEVGFFCNTAWNELAGDIESETWCADRLTHISLDVVAVLSSIIHGRVFKAEIPHLLAKDNYQRTTDAGEPGILAALYVSLLIRGTWRAQSGIC